MQCAARGLEWCDQCCCLQADAAESFVAWLAWHSVLVPFQLTETRCGSFTGRQQNLTASGYRSQPELGCSAFCFCDAIACLFLTALHHFAVVNFVLLHLMHLL